MRLGRFFSGDVLWAIICGMMYVLSYPPTAVWPLSIPAFGLFSWLLFEDRYERNKNYGFWHFFKLFFFFEFATRLSGLYWIPHTLIEFSEIPIVIAWLAGIGGFVLMSIPGSIVAGVLVPRVNKVSGAWLRVLAIFVFWIVWDYLDFRFFPWKPVQSFGVQKHLMASAGVLGTIGWNLIFFGMLSLLHMPLPLRRRLITWGAAWVVVLLTGGIIGHFQMERLRAKYSGRQKIAVLQGAVGNFEKRLQNREGNSPTNENVLRIYRDLIEKLALQQTQDKLGEVFVFWPETAFPGFPLNDSSLSQLLSSWAKITKGFHLIGAYEENSETHNGQEKMFQYNVVAAYSSSGEFRGHYRKVVRMPFGEYVPGDEYYPWIYDSFAILNNFGKGARHLPLPHDSEKGPVFLPFICFEILDEGFLREAVRSASVQFPNRDLILVNPTNDSWFGEGAELFLHSHLALWQVAREGLPMVRPTNTGISMIVAPWGEVLAHGRVGVESLILTDLPVSR